MLRPDTDFKELTMTKEMKPTQMKRRVHHRKWGEVLTVGAEAALEKVRKAPKRKWK